MLKNQRGDAVLVLQIIIVIIVGLLILAIPIVSIWKATNSHDVSFTVSKSERVCESGKNGTCRYLIYTDQGVYENTDSLWKGKWNSSDLYNQIKPNVKYNCEAIGFRVPFLSWYENVISCEESK